MVRLFASFISGSRFGLVYFRLRSMMALPVGTTKRKLYFVFVDTLQIAFAENEKTEHENSVPCELTDCSVAGLAGLLLLLLYCLSRKTVH